MNKLSLRKWVSRFLMAHQHNYHATHCYSHWIFWKCRKVHNLKIHKIHQLNTTQKANNSKTDLNKTSLVQLPFMPLDQEMKRAYSTTLPSTQGSCPCISTTQKISGLNSGPRVTSSQRPKIVIMKTRIYCCSI